MARGFVYLTAILDLYSRKVLAWRTSNTLSSDFCVDALQEALARFATIQPESLPTPLQHDLLRCYANFYEQKLVEARTIATRYANYPVERWRKLFIEVLAQLSELEPRTNAAVAVFGSPDPKPNREAQQSELATSEPSFDLKVENRSIALTWRNLPEVTINFYLMDPEFLFSSSPFATQDSARFAIIKPGKSMKQPLPAGKDTLDMPLPEEFQRANVLVEVLGAGQRKAQAYHANTLKLNLVENYGRLEIRGQGENQPVAKAYVKVYARLKSGAVRYFKDGYTDLRGKFDYASLNASEHDAPVPLARSSGSKNGLGFDHPMLSPGELGEVEKIAILIMSETHGALVREVNPPTE
jgi:hypothetical protein